jgi:hypothetical protein
MLLQAPLRFLRRQALALAAGLPQRVAGRNGVPGCKGRGAWLVFHGFHTAFASRRGVPATDAAFTPRAGFSLTDIKLAANAVDACRKIARIAGLSSCV